MPIMLKVALSLWVPIVCIDAIELGLIAEIVDNLFCPNCCWLVCPLGLIEANADSLCVPAVSIEPIQYH